MAILLALKKNAKHVERHNKKGLKVNNTETDILAQIIKERQRQDAKWGEQNLPIKDNDPQYVELAQFAKLKCDNALEDGTITWRHILQEEVAEAFAEDDPNKQAEELIQVAAVCVAMIEYLKRSGQIE